MVDRLGSVVTNQKEPIKTNGAAAPFDVSGSLDLAENEIPAAVAQTVAAFVEFRCRTLNERIFRLRSRSFMEIF